MKTIEILVVDDNEGDILLTTEALKEWKIKNRVVILKDGEEAIQYLNKEDCFSNAITPDLVILDLNLPKVDGKEVLQFIKNHPQLHSIPVFVFSTSSHEQDVLYVEKINAKGYITKPLDFTQFMKAVCSIENLWIGILQIPQTHKLYGNTP